MRNEAFLSHDRHNPLTMRPQAMSCHVSVPLYGCGGQIEDSFHHSFNLSASFLAWWQISYFQRCSIVIFECYPFHVNVGSLRSVDRPTQQSRTESFLQSLIENRPINIFHQNRRHTATVVRVQFRDNVILHFRTTTIQFLRQSYSNPNSR